MGLLSWLTRRTAARTLRHNPELAAAIRVSAKIFDSLPLKNHISHEFKDKKAGQLLSLIFTISNSEDPVAACRQIYVDQMIGYATYQVLVMASEPEEDPTGLRGQPGVTGELKGHLLEIAEKDERIREAMYGMTSEPTYDEVWDLCLLSYWLYHWYTNTLNFVRITLKDCNSGENPDWHLPLLHANCVWEEHHFRELIGLPSVIDRPDSFHLNAMRYATFNAMVLEGKTFPDLAWRDAYADEIASGELPLPDFGE